MVHKVRMGIALLCKYNLQTGPAWQQIRHSAYALMRKRNLGRKATSNADASYKNTTKLHQRIDESSTRCVAYLLAVVCCIERIHSFLLPEPVTLFSTDERLLLVLQQLPDHPNPIADVHSCLSVFSSIG